VIIDFHVHCFPDKLAPRAVSQLAANAGIPPRVDGTINGLKESMKRAGISNQLFSLLQQSRHRRRISITGPLKFRMKKLLHLEAFIRITKIGRQSFSG